MPIVHRLGQLLRRVSATGGSDRRASATAGAFRYGSALLATAVALAITILVEQFLTPTIFVVFMAAVAVSAAYWGRGPALLAIALSVLALHLFFTPPEGSFAIYEFGDVIRLAAFLLVALLVGGLSDRLRRARAAADARSEQLAELGRRLESQVEETRAYAGELEGHRAELEVQRGALQAHLEREQELNEELRAANDQLVVANEMAERMRSEAEEQGEYVRGILDGIADPFVVHSPEWRFHYINPAAARMMERSGHGSRERLIGKVVWEVYPELVGTAFEREMRRAMAERVAITFEEYYPVPSHWSEMRCYPLPDGNLATVWTDVTARKRTEHWDRLLSDMGAALAASTDPASALQALSELAVNTVADYCIGYLIDEGGWVRRAAQAHADPEKAALLRILDRVNPLADREHILHRLLQTEELMLFDELSDQQIRDYARNPEHLEAMMALAPRSTALIPLTARGRNLGALAVATARDGRAPLREQDRARLRQLGSRVALTLDNLRLYHAAEEARQRVEREASRTAELQAATAALSRSLTPAEVAESMIWHGSVAVGAAGGSLFLPGPDDRSLVLSHLVNLDPETLANHRVIPADADHPVAEVFRTGEPVVITSAADVAKRYPALVEDFDRVGAGALVSIPLRLEDQRLGVVNLRFTTPRTFPKEDLDWLSALTRLGVQALERARLHQTEREHVFRLRRLSEAALVVHSLPGLEDLLRAVTDHAFEIIGAHMAVARLEPDERTSDRLCVARLSDRFAEWRRYGWPDEELYARVRERNRAVRRTERELALDPAAAPFLEGRDGRPPLRGWLAAPLVDREGRNVGLIQLSNKRDGDFTDEDEQVIVQLAQMASIAIDNTRLYDEARRGVAARDDLLAAVSHEMRNSLIVITWTARRLERSGLGDDDRVQLIERIGNAVEQMQRLISDLLTVSHLEAGRLDLEPAETDPVELAREAQDILAGVAADQGLRLDLLAADGIPPVRLDRARVIEVLHNLIMNAIKYTPADGRIELGVAAEEGAVRFSVSDSGEGIGPEDLPHIFDRFRRAKSAGRTGTGLGLAISRGIVEAHGGRIWAESRPGRGSTFSFTIPTRTMAAAREFVSPPRGARD